MKNIVPLLIVLFAFVSIDAQPALKIDESATKAFFAADRLRVDLATENAARDSRAVVRLEILDAFDRVVAQHETRETIGRGRRATPVSIAFAKNPEIREMLWHRLRYRVSTGGATSASGIVALSEIMPELFELRVAAAERIAAGMRYPVRVRAFHPIRETPGDAVKVSAELTLDLDTEDEEDELKIKASATTGADGYALLTFDIPAGVKFDGDNAGEIEVTGEKNGLTSRAAEDLQTDGNRISVFFLADKPLYQPNQKFYARGLALRSGASDAAVTIAPEEEIEFTIKDEAGAIVFRQNARTSRFGVASIEWPIPESAKLGTYKLAARAVDDGTESETSFKISRYELPNFMVKTKSDKDFYLPGETTAEVTVDALYLFGKPVASGKVRVVREGRRQWNFNEQRWDIAEDAVYEGETDADGKFVARIDLSAAHENLAGSNEAFRDLSFAAYFTDPTTNRTEQRRFDVRVTRAPIHVYLTNASAAAHNPKLPVTIYVSTFSADGTPVACTAEIKGRYGREKTGTEKILARLKTNSFGAGKAVFTAPPLAAGAPADRLDVTVAARDALNRAGEEKTAYSIDRAARQILVRTDKTIYRPGEPVKIEVLSSADEETVFLDVSKNSSSLAARSVRLKNGRAALSVPFRRDFAKRLTVAAFFDERGEPIADSREIVFPAARALTIDAVTAKKTYRPNEEATVDFAVSGPDKRQTESALGVVVLDKAVEERARTDADFGAVNMFHNLGDLLPQRFDELDPKKPIAPEIQLSAEMAFRRAAFKPHLFGSNYAKDPQYVFSGTLGRDLQPVGNALQKHFDGEGETATDEDSLRRILRRNAIDFDALRDPWGSALRAKFTINQRYDFIEIKSAGANKVFGDGDDFTVQNYYFEYFRPLGAKIAKAVAEYHEKTGSVARDRETLREALLLHGVDLENLRDRWGEPYQININLDARRLHVNFQSSGPDRKPNQNNSYDDFWMWGWSFDYWAATEEKIRRVIDRYALDKKTFPQDEAEFKAILKAGGVDFDRLRDVWARPLYLETEVSIGNAGRIDFQIEPAGAGEKIADGALVTPVVRRTALFRVRSLGENGVRDKDFYADPVVSAFGGIVSERIDAKRAQLAVAKNEAADGRSIVYGIVRDRAGAVVPHAVLTVYHYQTGKTSEIKADAGGLFALRGLAAGNYSIKAVSDGFKTAMAGNVVIEAGKIVELNPTLEVGKTSETVYLETPGNYIIDPTDARINTIAIRQIEQLPVSGRSFSSLLSLSSGATVDVTAGGGFQINGASGAESVFIVDGQEIAGFRSGALKENKKSAADDDSAFDDDPSSATSRRGETPRLREYFPETLLWQPELVTDAAGRAQLKFRLADNITTWKMYAVASDRRGRVGVTAKEIRAFQPFFVDLDPPRVLTEGDEIHLPVQIRNYTKEKQSVNVEMAAGDWFSFLGESRRDVEVAAGAAETAVFGFRAERAVDEGKQKVTALAATEADAIEKPVKVRPDGHEVVRTFSQTFNRSAAFDVDFPAETLAGTPRAELKIYPNLLSHVAESVEGLLQRPYGCGEQTISSTYPNLMILKFAKNDAALGGAAERYLKKGYERLLGYREAGGGFSYWGNGDPNTALTAYAFRFLTDAKEFINVDENLLAQTRDWLIARQTADGSIESDATRTAYFARTLARYRRDEKSTAALNRALGFLKTKTADSTNVYALALYGLALVEAGEREAAAQIAERVEKLAVEDGRRVFWKLEGTTPFYGWGNPGQIETTALALQLFVKIETDAAAPSAGRRDLIGRATLYLLETKDRYGVWYSTQTTINVLDGFLAAMTENKTGAAQKVQIALNGAPLATLEIKPDQIAPLIVDLKGKMSTAANRVEIQTTAVAPLTAQLVAAHYVAWKDAEPYTRGRDMKLGYACDRLDGAVMEEVTCTVEAEKTTARPYGMLLAEIGLPPGTDVSRESLQQAMAADPHLSRYDVLPDRIVFYLWARPGGVRFDFKFKPRYPIRAKTPASFVYDYYNEEARATVAPLGFEVK